jgi:hypothetical protein
MLQQGLGLGLERILQGKLRLTNSLRIWLLHLLPRLHNRRPELLLWFSYRLLCFFTHACQNTFDSSDKIDTTTLSRRLAFSLSST